MSGWAPDPNRLRHSDALFCQARLQGGRLYLAPQGTRHDAPPVVWVDVGPIPDKARELTTLPDPVKKILDVNSPETGSQG